ncbi:MAG: SpoIIE family protein phosphatase [Acidobacteriota bacterium]
MTEDAPKSKPSALGLHVVPAEGPPFDRQIGQDAVVIGRSSKAEVVIGDRAMSREHARLFHTQEGWFLEDMGSRNGTLVNGQRVRQLAPIKAGDLVCMGGSTLRILDPARMAPEGVGADSAVGGALLRRASELVEESGSTSPGEEPHDEETLRQYLGHLRILNEVHKSLSRPMALQELLDLILDAAFDHLAADEGLILLQDADGGYRRAAARLKSDLDEPFVSRSLIHEVAERGMAALVKDVQADARFADSDSILSSGIRSLIAAPLQDAEGCLGMIALTSRTAVRSFGEEELALLASLASVAALRIRNLSLAEEAAERRRLQAEVELARRIQVELLPERMPEIPGYLLCGGNVPSRWVSGDYYEVSARREGKEVVLLLADVSGKGLGASLLAASLEALCAAPIEAGREPHQIFERVSLLLYRRTPPERYATAFAAVLEPETGVIRFANAGHPPALLLRRGGQAEWLGATGPPLGLFPESAYETRSTGLDPGDFLILYSDGISEASDREGEPFGREGLLATCSLSEHRGPHDVAKALEETLEAYCGGEPHADDRTLLILQRFPAPAP